MTVPLADTVRATIGRRIHADLCAAHSWERFALAARHPRLTLEAGRSPWLELPVPRTPVRGASLSPTSHGAKHVCRRVSQSHPIRADVAVWVGRRAPKRGRIGCVTEVRTDPDRASNRALATTHALGAAVTRARDVQFQSILTAAKTRRGFRVVGDAGAGKTSLLRHVAHDIAERDEGVVVYLNIGEVCGESDLVWLCLRQLLPPTDPKDDLTLQRATTSSHRRQRFANALREALDAEGLERAYGNRPFTQTDGVGTMRSLLDCLARCDEASGYSIVFVIDQIEPSLLPSSPADGVPNLLNSLLAETGRHRAISVGVAHRPGLEHVADPKTVQMVCESQDAVTLSPIALPAWERIVLTSIEPPPKMDLVDLVSLTQGHVATMVGVLSHLASRTDEAPLDGSPEAGAELDPWTSAGAFASLAAGRRASRDAFMHLVSMHAPSVYAFLQVARQIEVTGPSIMQAVACNNFSRQRHALAALHADERTLRRLQFAGLIREHRDAWLMCNPLTARALRDRRPCGDR